MVRMIQSERNKQVKRKGDMETPETEMEGVPREGPGPQGVCALAWYLQGQGVNS